MGNKGGRHGQALDERTCAVALRRATPDGALLLATHRARVWQEVGDWGPELDAQIPAWERYFHGAIADETYVAYVAERDGEIVGSGALLMQRAVPRPGYEAEFDARMHSVYVLPHARRRGIARAIVEALVAYARARPVLRIVLHPSDEARPLYESLGFTVANEMVLRIADGHG